MAKKKDSEKRRARISIVVTENLRDELSRLAKAFGFSLNDFCCKSLELVAKKNSSSIQEIETAQATLDKVQADLNFARKNALIKFENTFAADERIDTND